MGLVSTWMRDHLSALLMFLIALQQALVDQKAFWPCLAQNSGDEVSYGCVLVCQSAGSVGIYLLS